MSDKGKVLQELAVLKSGHPPRADAGIFGASIPLDLAQIVLLPVPFEATTSYGGGTSQGPVAILKASHQLDLFDSNWGNPSLTGIALLESSPIFHKLNNTGKALAREVIASWEQRGKPKDDALKKVNDISTAVNEAVYHESKNLLSQNKIVGVIGGDHSCPFGLMQALGEDETNYGILHIDAHHDLRKAYEGFEHSHASIMYNALEKIPGISRILSVAIRDFSEEEYRLAQEHKKVETLYDLEIVRRLAHGEHLLQIFKEALWSLPDNIYISFDIDGLEPYCCPHTGTPVAGGLRFQEAILLVELAVQMGKKVIGFDLCEVCPGDDEWDANVGARILYKLCGAVAVSHKMRSLLDS